MHAVVVAIAVVPLAAAVGAWLVGARWAPLVTIVSALVTFGLSLVLVPHAASHAPVTLGHWFRVDALSVVFLLSVSFLYAATAVYAFGYLAAEREAEDFPRYGRRFWAGLNLFAWSMALAPLAQSRSPPGAVPPSRTRLLRAEL